jgi:hypothetical protein
LLVISAGKKGGAKPRLFLAERLFRSVCGLKKGHFLTIGNTADERADKARFTGLGGSSGARRQ